MAYNVEMEMALQEMVLHPEFTNKKLIDAVDINISNTAPVVK